MIKRLIATIITIVMMLSLTACGTTDVVYSGGYDSAKYTQVTDISGTSMLVPKEIYDAAEDISKASEYESADLPNHVFTSSDSKSYSIYQPGSFFLYAFDLGRIEGIEDKQDVKDIPGLIGASWLACESRNPNTYTSTEKDGNTQILYGATITESMVGSELTYNGYVAILHNEATSSDYCLIIGYGNNENDSTAKEIAENFLLMNQAE